MKMPVCGSKINVQYVYVLDMIRMHCESHKNPPYDNILFYTLSKTFPIIGRYPILLPSPYKYLGIYKVYFCVI